MVLIPVVDTEVQHIAVGDGVKNDCESA